MPMANKKKIATSVAAVAMAAAMLLGGTFAWQSISQTALNEASDIVNPGGRLHDDFDGENKDVYVENFADEPIYARVRLGEYMEIVVNKGMGDNLEKTVEVIGSRNFDADGNVESYNYDVFKNYERDGEFNAGVDKTDPDKSWWTWTTGGSTVYMPTFNLNKDSLEADVNGTLQGPDGVVTDAEDDDRYSDYVTYEDGETEEGLEIYDADSNNIDEVGDNFDNLTQYETTGNIVTISADEEGDPISHTAKPTGTAQLISMEEWLAMNDIEAAAAAATTADDPYGVAPAFAANAVATLHYDKNADNATGEITDVTEPYGSFLTLSDGADFTREGYTLVSWNTKADGSGTNYGLGQTGWMLPEGETTLYAVWQKNDSGTGGGTDDENTQDDEPAYWVYDEDGWVYYSKPIQPHTATGLLLSGIELNEVMDDSWYYAIQVTGQFITADDLGSMEDGTGFYDTDAGNIPSVNALKLLKAIGVEVPENGTTGDEGEPDYTFDLGDALPEKAPVVPLNSTIAVNAPVEMANPVLGVTAYKPYNLESFPIVDDEVDISGSKLMNSTSPIGLTINEDYTYENGLLTITNPEYVNTVVALLMSDGPAGQGVKTYKHAIFVVEGESSGGEVRDYTAEVYCINEDEWSPWTASTDKITSNLNFYPVITTLDGENIDVSTATIKNAGFSVESGTFTCDDKTFQLKVTAPANLERGPITLTFQIGEKEYLVDLTVIDSVEAMLRGPDETGLGTGSTVYAGQYYSINNESVGSMGGYSVGFELVYDDDPSTKIVYEPDEFTPSWDHFRVEDKGYKTLTVNWKLYEGENETEYSGTSVYNIEEPPIKITYPANIGVNPEVTYANAFFVDETYEFDIWCKSTPVCETGVWGTEALTELTLTNTGENTYTLTLNPQITEKDENGNLKSQQYFYFRVSDGNGFNSTWLEGYVIDQSSNT